MNLRAAGVVILALVAAGCGGHGATQFEGPVASPVATFGQCAFCHNPVATNMVVTAPDLKCQTCHADQEPGTVGPGHRCIPGEPCTVQPVQSVPSFPGPLHLLHAEAPFGSCAYCHNQNAVNMAPTHGELLCPVCHDNLLPGTYGPGHRSVPGPARVPSFPNPIHLLHAEAPFDSCAFCHNDKAINMVPVSSELNCAVCHDNRTPGSYGPGHEGLPGSERVPSFVGAAHLPPPAQVPFGSCTYCHNDKAVNMAPVSNDLQCVVCHDDRKPGTFGPGHRGIPGPELVPAFAGPTHALGAEAPFESCAYCHNDKATNMTASGVSVSCTFCHATALSPDFGPGHRSLPGPDQVQSFPGPAHKLGPEAVYGQCGFCHNATTVTALMSSGHGALSLVCENCHTVLRPNDYGPGHERAPRCAECHTEQHTHQDPAVGTVKECTNCHTPHGSTNIFLVNEQIQTPNRGTHTVVFNNILGLADGSFASVTQPGTGVCETCHTRTDFYRSDGTGQPHFPYPCFTCHPHAGGFAPN
jgi:predicted CXXCH cytochrome family protein